MKDGARIYLDSSILLGQLLRESEISGHLVSSGVWITSEITDLECRRTLDRIRLNEKVSDNEIADRLTELDAMLKSIRVIQLTAPVIKRAKAPYPTVVRSLDAIHLATAELAKCSTFVTHDKQRGVAARALGFGT